MPLDLAPSFDSLCVPQFSFADQLCVEFPGGFNVCASDYELGDPTTIVKGMLKQLNTALVPLGPFFKILDVIKAVFDCIMAIPDSLGPPPDPTALLACVPALQKAVDAVLAMLPPFPIFKLVKGILNVIITLLQGLKLKIQAWIKQVNRILNAAIAAEALGNIQLQLVVDCANGNMDAQLSNLNQDFEPLNRLLGIVNILLQLVGLDCIPSLSGFGEISEAVLAPIDAIIQLLEMIYALIPVGLPSLPSIPPAGDC